MGQSLFEVKDPIREQIQKQIQNQGIPLRLEGIDPNEPIVTFREETVVKTIQQVETHLTVLVRSPPFSGKNFFGNIDQKKIGAEQLQSFHYLNAPFCRPMMKNFFMKCGSIV